MPRPSTGRKPVTVRLDPVDIEWLAAAAQARGIDPAECLRRLVAGARIAATGGDPEPINRQIRPSEQAVRAAMTRPGPHKFKSQTRNGLRCEHCGVLAKDHP